VGVFSEQCANAPRRTANSLSAVHFAYINKLLHIQLGLLALRQPFASNTQLQYLSK